MKNTINYYCPMVIFFGHKNKIRKSNIIKNMKNALKLKWTNQIRPHHHLQPLDPFKHARFSVLGLMFRSTVHTHFSIKINDSNHKSKFKLPTTSCFLQNSK